MRKEQGKDWEGEEEGREAGREKEVIRQPSSPKLNVSKRTLIMGAPSALSHLNGPRYFSCLRLHSIKRGGTIINR